MFRLLLPLFERALLVLKDKFVSTIILAKSLSSKEIESLALSHQNIIKFLTETPKKIIYIPNKIINIVI